MADDALLARYDALYRPERPFTRLAMDLLVERVLRPRLAGRVFAELGISTGVVTVRLAPLAARMVLIDANPTYCEAIRERLAPLGTPYAIHCAYFEALDFACLAEVTDVFLLSMVHVLPGQWAELLGRVRGAVGPGARLHVTMSNRRALNRLVGLHMGLLDSLDAVDAQAAAFDTRYVEAEEVAAAATARGWRLLASEGFLCRPLTLDAMDPLVDAAALDLLYRMGHALPPAFCNTTYQCYEAAPCGA